MVEINITYEGDLRCKAQHQPSGSVLLTDAPVDNQGKGEAFSPTDLVATALGTCILTTMGIVAKPMNVDLRGAKVSVKKEMATKPSRRIGALTVVLDIPVSPTPEQKQRLEEVALKSPVHHSLHPDEQMPIAFNWA